MNEILDLEIFQLIIVIGGWGVPCEIAIRWVSLDFTDGKLILAR